MKSDYYILDADHNIHTTNDPFEWGAFFEDADKRRVAETTVGKRWVSTVFLGIDHNYGEGRPLLFETMVFDHGDGDGDEITERYATWDEAVAGHERIVAQLQADQAMRAVARGDE